MFSRTRMPSAATALLGLAALFSTPASAADSGVALRLDQHRKHRGLRSGPAAVCKGGRGGIRRAHRSGAEAARRLRQAGRTVHHGREGRHRDGGERAGVPSRPLPAVVGDGAALHVRELDLGHLGDDVALQGRPARQGLRLGEGARSLRAAALSDLHHRQEDPVGEGFPRPAHAHAEHHRRRGAGQARRGAARHPPQHDRRHHRQRLCRRHRLWLGLRDDDQGCGRQDLWPISSRS